MFLVTLLNKNKDMFVENLFTGIMITLHHYNQRFIILQQSKKNKRNKIV